MAMLFLHLTIKTYLTRDKCIPWGHSRPHCVNERGKQKHLAKSLRADSTFAEQQPSILYPSDSSFIRFNGYSTKTGAHTSLEKHRFNQNEKYLQGFSKCTTLIAQVFVIFQAS